MHPCKLAIAAVFCLTAFAASAPAQDAQKIGDQYIKAVGGSKALSKARTITIEGTFQTPEAKSGTYALNTRLPNPYNSELLAGDNTLTEAYNDKSSCHRT